MAAYGGYPPPGYGAAPYGAAPHGAMPAAAHPQAHYGHPAPHGYAPAPAGYGAPAYGHPPHGHPAYGMPMHGYPPQAYGYGAPGAPPSGAPGAPLMPPPPQGAPPQPGRQPEKKRDRDRDRGRGDGAAGAAKDAKPQEIVVSGCADQTVGGIVRGDFKLDSENHGRPVYKKTTQVHNLDVMIYFWDDRDGPSFCGWWFGPKVGGDQVWAYHPEKQLIVPTSGWKVPYDGPVDASFKIEPKVSEKQKEKERLQQQARDEKQKQDEEARRKKAEEVAKRQAEEATRREEEAKRKAEDEARKREDEKKRKMDFEEKRRQEQRSTLAIRRVIQKVRGATPDNFEELQKELQDVLEAELQHTGTQKQRVTDESEKGLEQARKRIEQLNEQRRKEQEKRDAEEAVRREAVERAMGLVMELQTLIEAAEAEVQHLKATAAPLEEATDLTVDDVERTAVAVEDIGAKSKVMTKACTDFILLRGNEMKDASAPVPGSFEPSETKQILAKLLQRINECTRMAGEHVTSARGAKSKATRRAAAREKMRDLEVCFNRYDRDFDNHLSRKEVLAWAISEYGFVVPEETLNHVWKTIVEERSKGVPMHHFQWLRTIVGVARERSRDQQRQAQQAEKDKVLRDMKARLSDKVKETGLAVDEADRLVLKTEDQVKPFLSKAKAMPFVEMLILADETDEMINEAKDAMTSVREAMDVIGEGLDGDFEEDLRAHLVSEAKQLELRVGRMGSRINRASNLCERFRQQATKKRAAELERVRLSALKVIRFNQKLKGLTGDELFTAMDADGDNLILEDDFVQFLIAADKNIRELDSELGDTVSDEAPSEGHAVKFVMGGEEVKAEADLTESMLPKLFAYLLEDGEVGLSRETLARHMRAYMKVVRETVLSAGFGIKTTCLRRLELNEVVEILEGPFKESSVDLLRARARVMKDGLEGWVTVAGNAGVVFLKEGGSHFKVVKETLLTSTFELDSTEDTGGAQPTSRMLREDEVLEVLEWPRTEKASGLVRMKAKSKSNGSVGWATMVGSSGAVFLEVV